MRVGGRTVRRGHLAAAASGLGLLGVVAAHRGSSPVIPGALPSRPGATTTTTPKGSGSPGPTSSTVPPPSTSPSGTRTAVGAAEQYGYGVLSVKVTVTGGKIVDIAVAQLQTAEQYSQDLATQVIPTLRNEILSAQSTRVNAVSGATYTSEAYAYSVQSALDQLHI